MENSSYHKSYMLQNIFQSAPIGIGLVCDRIIREVNDRLCEIVDYDRDELVGQDFKMLYPTEEDFEHVGLENYETAGSRCTGAVETHWRRKDRDTIDVLLCLSDTTFDNLSRGFTFAALDITNRKRADAEFSQSEERCRSLIESIDDSLYLVDADCTYLFVNKVQLSRLGKEQPEVEGRKYSEFHPSDDAKTFLKKVQEVLQTGCSVRYEHRSRKDNKYFLRTLSPIKDSTGKTNSVLTVSKDITVLKHAEAALKESAEQVKLFSYSISHDLKNPAISIYLLTRRLEKNFENVLDENARSYCRQIHKAAEQIKHLVGQINTYISTREVPLHIESVDMNGILEEIKMEFSGVLDNRRIMWSHPYDIPAMKIDRISIMRVLRNLVDNALKHGGDNLTEIKIGYSGFKKFHILSVYDDGLGIGNSNLKTIFNKFHRNESSVGVEGVGLGLAIVKTIAEHHGGDAWVEPNAEKGKTFYLSISKFL
jgi:PAS domain S-box-containing protein